MSEQRNGEPWRDWVERELRHLEEKIDLRLGSREKALELQAAEYERRLRELNHEAARLKEAASLAVSREKYDADREGDRAALDLVKAQVIEEAARNAGREIEKSKGLTTGLAVLALVISILGVVARVLW